MKYFSAFSGIGGFELAAPEDWECVGYSEILPRAIEIYQKHFPNHKNYGDITTIIAEDLPDFDLFVGGFPDNWTEGVPKTVRKFLLGNAITPNIPKEIFINLPYANTKRKNH